MPNSEPEMIGALIGLFLLSIGFRALVAAQGFLEAYLHLHYYPRHHARQVARSLQKEQTQENEDEDEDDQEDGECEKNGQSVGFEDEKSDQSPHSQQQQQEQDIPEDHAVLTPVLLQHDPSLHHIHVEIAESPTSFPPASRRGFSSTSHSRPARLPRRHRPSTFQSSATSSFGLFPTPQPFVWQADVARAVLTTGVVGIGYMLMLVIMTYNSAYFGAILAGIFVGEIYFARWGRARPIFPSSPSRRVDRRFDTIDFEETSRPLCDQTADNSNHTNIPPSFNSRPLETWSRQQLQQQIAPVSIVNSSRASVISTTSSRGYSSTMVHHGADGSC